MAQRFVLMLLVGMQYAVGASVAHAQGGAAATAKDIVLAGVASAAQLAPGAPSPDALAVSVLVEGPYGMLTPRPVDASFSNGDRFRIKLLSPRDGDILVYNTTPRGVTGQAPIWKTSVKSGVETISDPMQVVGDSGEDQLHVVLQPKTAPASPFAWFQNLFSSGKTGKDIRLVTENTQQATYFYNPNGQGGYVTIRIRH